MSLNNTPKVYELVLDYMPVLDVTDVTPSRMEIESTASVVLTGYSFDTVTAISWNGQPVSFVIVNPTRINVTLTNMLTSGSYPFYLESPTRNVYSPTFEIYVSQFGQPPTVGRRLRGGKFLSRLGFVKFPSK